MKIETIAELEAHYGAANERSLWKEVDHVTAQYRALIEASPFVVVASCGPEGMDCTPRGDPAPVVTVEDPKTLFLPDRRGNNRIDTLRNLVHDPRIALLFLIPGVGETMRINGSAEILTDPTLLERFALHGKPPSSVLKITVDRAYFQCQKALARSRLWDQASIVDRKSLPTSGEILEALAPEPFDGDEYNATYPAHMKKTIY
ncbi:MAG: pyridoxamine 5'-phosphate oxidase family protein [Neomegalonema sp.]|nr:pyridoxamine 5'-phosphate oxidase family protein [Neomegalonema sp.]